MTQKKGSKHAGVLVCYLRESYIIICWYCLEFQPLVQGNDNHKIRRTIFVVSIGRRVQQRITLLFVWKLCEGQGFPLFTML